MAAARAAPSASSSGTAYSARREVVASRTAGPELGAASGKGLGGAFEVCLELCLELGSGQGWGSRCETLPMSSLTRFLTGLA